jgi:hypothetical protein
MHSPSLLMQSRNLLNQSRYTAINIDFSMVLSIVSVVDRSASGFSNEDLANLFFTSPDKKKPVEAKSGEYDGREILFIPFASRNSRDDFAVYGSVLSAWTHNF